MYYCVVQVPVGLFSHMKVHHNFDFEHITHNFNFYQKVKVVNYIRCCVSITLFSNMNIDFKV